MNCISYLDSFGWAQSTWISHVYSSLVWPRYSFFFHGKIYIFSFFIFYIFSFILFYSILYDRLVGFISFPLRFIPCYANTLASSKQGFIPHALRFGFCSQSVYIFLVMVTHICCGIHTLHTHICLTKYIFSM